MALELEWYDLVCFGIVGVTFLGSLWVLCMHEGASKSELGSLDETLLVGREENGMVVSVVQRGRITGGLSRTQLWSSCWPGMQPLWVLVSRFLSFVTMAILLLLDVREYDVSIFLYYTEWTFTLVMIYFALGTIISAHGCWQYINKPPPENGEMDLFLRRDLEESMPTNFIAYKEKETKGSIGLQCQYVEEEFKQRVGFWGYVMQITYQTSAGAVILTDIVFWCVIVPFLSISHFKLNMFMGAMHSLNAVFLLLDTALNNLPFPWFRVTYFVLWSCGYIIFQWIIHACGFTWWPYPFLELDTPWAPIWYLCLAVIHIPCYGLYSLIVKAKNMIFLRFFPRSFFRIY